MSDPTTYRPEPEVGSDEQLGELVRRRIARRCYLDLLAVQSEDEHTSDVALPDDAPG